jgi:asparagine synthase (glutamine-hydrolysing)
MCGISGVFNFDGSLVDCDSLISMNNFMYHRGPDSGSTSVFGHVGLGHRRLSIIDLSDTGNQPMFDKTGRYCIVYNGEIYNFKELKKQLLNFGYEFKGTSDSEVILYLYIFLGVNAFALLKGMFAIGIYDTELDVLTLVRDHLGIKPLKYYLDSNSLIFASEINAIKAYKKLKLNLDSQAFIEYLWYSNPLGNNTFYNEIKELGPGEVCIVSKKGISISSFFNINEFEEKQINEKELIDKIELLLIQSIERHMISDVPVGVFLSGGIDSSIITAFASEHAKSKINTFSIAFESEKNELSAAKEISKLFNTNHYEYRLLGSDASSIIKNLINNHGEPFGDAADIPLSYLASQVKNINKVVLQGDGGDEIFGGYSRYFTVSKIKYFNLVSKLLFFINYFEPNSTKLLQIKRFINAISQSSPVLRNALLLTMESKNYFPQTILNKEYYNFTLELDPFKRYEEVYSKYSKKDGLTQSIFKTDFQIILKDTFLPKVDISTMSNSIEARVPFLDLDIIQFMATVPASLKLKNGTTKYLLKKILERKMPKKLIYRRKTGFGVPYDSWLINSFKNEFLENLKSPKMIQYFDINEIKRIYQLHCKGIGNYGILLWKVYIFSVWINIEN